MLKSEIRFERERLQDILKDLSNEFVSEVKVLDFLDEVLEVSSIKDFDDKIYKEESLILKIQDHFKSKCEEPEKIDYFQDSAFNPRLSVEWAEHDLENIINYFSEKLRKLNTFVDPYGKRYAS